MIKIEDTQEEDLDLIRKYFCKKEEEAIDTNKVICDMNSKGNLDKYRNVTLKKSYRLDKRDMWTNVIKYKQKSYNSKINNTPLFEPFNILKKNQKYRIDLTKEILKTGKYHINIILPIIYCEKKGIIQISIYDKNYIDLKYLKNYFIENNRREIISINTTLFKRSNSEENIILTIYNLGTDIQFENNFKISITKKDD